MSTPIKPIPPTPGDEPFGIHQSDIIIRSAIILAIEDMRANPWLLDWVFTSLPRDTDTAQEYGFAEAERAKEWFLRTNIAVFLNTHVNDLKFPCVSISLQSSGESETQLGDVHYEPNELNGSAWNPLTPKFTPTSYDVATGRMVVPDLPLIIARKQLVVDKLNNAYEILQVNDRNTFYITPGIIADFTGAVIKGQKPAYIAAIESVNYRETYLIGCHAQGEPVYLVYLHSIMVFILNRYKERYLERRGLERTILKSSDFAKNDALDPEFIYSRYIELSGNVRQYWPKDITERIQAVIPQLRVGEVAHILSPKPSITASEAIKTQYTNEAQNAPLLGEDDPDPYKDMEGSDPFTADLDFGIGDI